MKPGCLRKCAARVSRFLSGIAGVLHIFVYSEGYVYLIKSKA